MVLAAALDLSVLANGLWPVTQTGTSSPYIDCPSPHELDPPFFPPQGAAFKGVRNIPRHAMHRHSRPPFGVALGNHADPFILFLPPSSLSDDSQGKGILKLETHAVLGVL